MGDNNRIFNHSTNCGNTTHHLGPRPDEKNEQQSYEQLENDKKLRR